MTPTPRWRVSCGMICRLTDAEAAAHRRAVAATVALCCVGLMGSVAWLALAP